MIIFIAPLCASGLDSARFTVKVSADTEEDTVDKFGKSQPVKRVEDARFLRGTGQYVDDQAPEGALFAWFLRSPVAHALVTELDLSDAREAEGVHAVYCQQDLLDAGVKATVSAATVKDGVRVRRPVLAEGRVRYVGEAVAMVVADSIAAARDAAELIGFEFDDLPVQAAPVVGGAPVHEAAPDNLAYDFEKGDAAAVEAALAASAHVVECEVVDNRVIANSLEPRGCWAQITDGRLHMDFTGQGVWGLKSELAKFFALDPEQVRVTTPDVGGGFGMKGMNYPEYFAVAHATRDLGRPVRWMSDRSEAMQTDNAGRDLVSLCRLGFDADFRLTAYAVDTVSNLGAYNAPFAQFIQSELFAKVLMGTYDLQTSLLRVKGVFTNTTPVDAYRGAGRPEAIFALERAMDQAARELGVDPWELRRRNFIRQDQFPYRSATGEMYDVGDFHKVLARCEAESDRSGFEARRAQSAAAGKLRGQGLCYYIESILGDPEETAAVEFTAAGQVNLFVGTQSNGQGHETVYAQFLADQTGIDAALIDVIQGDSDRIAKGGGTGGSRSVTTQNTATLATAGALVDGFAAFLAQALGIAPEKLQFDDENYRIADSNMVFSMMDVAEQAREAGRDDLLKVTRTTTLDGRSYPNGAHVAEVEIDPETGAVKVDRYVVVDDLGNLINPMLVEGQIHGGVVQGIGQAISEHTVYDEEGQLLTASFMDYGLPRAADVPFVKFVSEPVPSTANAMGMKGCGEAGTVGALAAVANAVTDALWDQGVRRIDMPFTPQRVWKAMTDATP
jgi:aerobic carbon-monoxide dehydrogenase large subunit